MSDTSSQLVIATPIGSLRVTCQAGKLIRVEFVDEIAPDDSVTGSNALLHEARQQLNAYFAGRLHKFDLPLAPAGTEFQLKVLQALQQIPWGETRSYGELAAMIGHPKSARAVGMANNRNPLPIIIPCHRVIGRNGKLVGYAGGLAVQQALLELEAAKV